jgi:xanthine/uracil permease
MTHKKHEGILSSVFFFVGFANNGSDNHGFTFSPAFLLLEGDLRKKNCGGILPCVQIMVCCWYQVLVSVCPPRALRRIFPPVVTGSCLILLGISLVTTGFQEWGGGSYWQV